MTKFIFFPLSTISCDTFIEAMDTPTRKNQSDDESCNRCSNCSQIFLMPALIIVDSFTLPFRGIYYCVRRK